MVESENYYELIQCIENWARKIFSIHQTKFYIVENDCLIYYISKEM